MDMDTSLSQRKLNQYLQEKNVNALFVQIVQAMLIERPNDPILYTYNYLQAKYPDICKAPSAPPRASSGGAALVRDGAPSPQRVKDEDNGEGEECQAYSDTDDDDEDEMGEVRSS